MLNVIIIGIGNGGRSLLPILKEDPDISILCAVGRKIDSPGLVYARELGIPTSIDYLSAVKENLDLVNVIIDASGIEEIDRTLKQILPPAVEVISGLSAKLMWELVEERKRREDDLSTLYNIGLLLTSAKDTDETLLTIVESTTKLVGTPAASLTLFDDERKEFELRIAVGFSDNFASRKKWKIRKGGLSDKILASPFPTIIKDVASEPGFDNPVLISEGVCSILAAPLIINGKVLGILYADDFKTRDFAQREVSIFSLLASQAALAIEKASILEKNKELAITDGLTKLYNHRYFQEISDAEVARAARYERAVSLILIDIDHFKNFNDKNGHPQGDVLLKKVARVISSTCRQSDIVARYGGEEFAIILPETETKQAFNTAERIRKKLEALVVAGMEYQPLKKITISAGVATYPYHASTKVDLLKRADDLLYEAKNSGRNQVHTLAV